MRLSKQGQVILVACLAVAIWAGLVLLPQQQEAYQVSHTYTHTILRTWLSRKLGRRRSTLTPYAWCWDPGRARVPVTTERRAGGFHKSSCTTLQQGPSSAAGLDMVCNGQMSDHRECFRQCVYTVPSPTAQICTFWSSCV